MKLPVRTPAAICRLLYRCLERYRQTIRPYLDCRRLIAIAYRSGGVPYGARNPVRSLGSTRNPIGYTRERSSVVAAFLRLPNNDKVAMCFPMPPC
jgi:hypothetical protein